MSRFDDCYDDEGVPWALWERVVSNALGGQRGQAALAEIEAALMALPRPRLVDGALADEDEVCAVGAFVAHRRAKREGTDTATVIKEMCEEGGPEDYGIFETAEAGRDAGLSFTVAWHMAYLNDEKFGLATPEKRYEQMLAWVRRAQGKDAAAA
jgi:hypothetical protein